MDDKHHSTFIEVGPCSPEKSSNLKEPYMSFHHPTDPKANTALIINGSEQFYTLAMISSNLVRRQQQIAEGKTKASSDNLVGVNIQANKEVLSSAPYLAHLDYVKGVKEFTELADYVTINIADFTTTSGIMHLPFKSY